MEKHKIGENSPYDGDMDLIESFVLCSKNPNDLMLADEITSYYVSRALYYWRKLKEYLKEKEISKGSHLDENEYVQDELVVKIFFERVKERIKLYEQSFLSLNFENKNSNEKSIKKLSHKKLYELVRTAIYTNYEKYQLKPLYEIILGENIPLSSIHSSYEELFDELYPLPEEFLTQTEKKIGKKVEHSLLDFNSMFYNPMRLNNILKNFQKYEDTFSDMLESIQNKRGPFDNRAFIELFAYIGKLNCLYLNNESPSNYKEYENLQVDKIFLIVNGNGAFSLNTWLYAYFEGIDLLGFTTKRSFYNGNDGCSLDMFEHDIGHITEAIKFKKYGKTFQKYKKIYYQIINSDFLEQRKSCLYSHYGQLYMNL